MFDKICDKLKFDFKSDELFHSGSIDYFYNLVTSEHITISLFHRQVKISNTDLLEQLGVESFFDWTTRIVFTDHKFGLLRTHHVIFLNSEPKLVGSYAQSSKDVYDLSYFFSESTFNFKNVEDAEFDDKSVKFNIDVQDYTILYNEFVELIKYLKKYYAL